MTDKLEEKDIVALPETEVSRVETNTKTIDDDAIERMFFEHGETQSEQAKQLKEVTEVLKQRAETYTAQMESLDSQQTQELKAILTRRRSDVAKQAEAEYKARTQKTVAAAKEEYKYLRNLLDMVGTFKTTKDVVETPKPAPVEPKPKARPKSAYEGRTDIPAQMVEVGMTLEKRRADLEDKLEGVVPHSDEQRKLFAEDQQLRDDLFALNREINAIKKKVVLEQSEQWKQRERDKVAEQEEITRLEKEIEADQAQLETLQKDLASATEKQAEYKKRMDELTEDPQYQLLFEQQVLAYLETSKPEKLFAYKENLSPDGEFLDALTGEVTTATPSNFLTNKEHDKQISDFENNAIEVKEVKQFLQEAQAAKQKIEAEIQQTKQKKAGAETKLAEHKEHQKKITTEDATKKGRPILERGEEVVKELAAKEIARQKAEGSFEKKQEEKKMEEKRAREEQLPSLREQLATLEKEISERDQRIETLANGKPHDAYESAARMLADKEERHARVMEAEKLPNSGRSLEDNPEYKNILERLALDLLKKSDPEILKTYKSELSPNGKLITATTGGESFAPSALLGEDGKNVATQAKEEFKKTHPEKAVAYEKIPKDTTVAKAEYELTTARDVFVKARDAKLAAEKELKELQEKQTVAKKTRKEIKQLEATTVIESLKTAEQAATETPTPEPTEKLPLIKRLKEQAQLLDAMNGPSLETDDIRDVRKKADREAKAAEREVNTILQQYSERINQMHTLKRMQKSANPRERALAELVLADKNSTTPELAPALHKRYQELTGEKIVPKLVKRQEPTAAIERWERAYDTKVTEKIAEQNKSESDAQTIPIPELLDRIGKLLERIEQSPNDPAAADEYERLNAIAEKRMGI